MGTRPGEGPGAQLLAGHRGPHQVTKDRQKGRGRGLPTPGLETSQQESRRSQGYRSLIITLRVKNKEENSFLLDTRCR